MYSADADGRGLFLCVFVWHIDMARYTGEGGRLV